MGGVLTCALFQKFLMSKVGKHGSFLALCMALALLTGQNQYSSVFGPRVLVRHSTRHVFCAALRILFLFVC